MTILAKRKDDMSPSLHLQISEDNDGDLIVSIMDGRIPVVHVEYCSIMGTGVAANSQHTRAALKLLALAMAEDNRQSPHPAA